ncbi:MAG: site-specific integrase, partial [Acidimicrobiia bacterium]
MGELTGPTSGPPRAASDELARLVEEHQSWLAVERSLAASSLAAYRRDLRRYEAFLLRQSLPASSIGERTVAAYLEHLRGLTTPEGTPRLVASSIARALVAVRSFHRFCLTEGHLASDPTEDLGVPRVPRGIPKALSEA